MVIWRMVDMVKCDNDCSVHGDRRVQRGSDLICYHVIGMLRSRSVSRSVCC